MPLNPLDCSVIPIRKFAPLARLSDLREIARCELHGDYLIRSAEGGTVLVHNPSGCPACVRAARVGRFLSATNIPARFADCNFDNYDAETDKQKRVLAACREYADGFASHLAAGRGLILVGNPGTGKNHLATAIAKNVSKQGYVVLRVKASEFLDEFWAKDFGERDAWMRRLSSVCLLILDEVGRTSSTANAQNAFFRLIDGRYEVMRPTVVLSNLDRQGLIDVLGEAAYDRLAESGTKRLTFDWESRRATAKKEST